MGRYAFSGRLCERFRDSGRLRSGRAREPVSYTHLTLPFYEEENFSYYLDLDKGLSSLTGVTYQPADEKAAADYTVLQAEVGQTTTLFSVDESSMWRNYLDNEYRDALKQAVNGDMTAEEALNDFAAALAEKSGWAQ